MPSQTTFCDKLAGLFKIKVLLAFEGVTSATSNALARNINQVHTLRTNVPFSDALNACGRFKDSLHNTPTDDQYRLELTAEQDAVTQEYFWQLSICLNLGTDVGEKEIIIFRGPVQVDPLDANVPVTTWSRKSTEQGTNLDFSTATITLNYTQPTPAVPPPTAGNFYPQQKQIVSQPVVISWTGNYESYDVEFGLGNNLGLVSAAQPNRTYDPGPLVEGETYWYRITGNRSDGFQVQHQWFSFSVGSVCEASNYSPTGLVDETSVDLTWDGTCSLWDVYFGPPGNLTRVAEDTPTRSVTVAVAQCKSYEWYVVGKDTATPQVFPTQTIECVTDRGVDIGFDEGFGLTSCNLIPGRDYGQDFGEDYGPRL